MVSHDMLVKVIPDCVTTATQKGSAQTELGPKLEFKGSTKTLYWSE